MRFDTPIVWPHGARCAVMLTFDLDAEFVWMDMDKTVADRPKTRSIGEYGPRRGVARILRVLDHYRLRGRSWSQGKTRSPIAKPSARSRTAATR